MFLFLCRRSTVRQTADYCEWVPPRQTQPAMVSGDPLSCTTGPTAELRQGARRPVRQLHQGTISCGTLILTRASGCKMTKTSRTSCYFIQDLSDSQEAHAWTIITVLFRVNRITVPVWTPSCIKAWGVFISKCCVLIAETCWLARGIGWLLIGCQGIVVFHGPMARVCR